MATSFRMGDHKRVGHKPNNGFNRNCFRGYLGHPKGRLWQRDSPDISCDDHARCAFATICHCRASVALQKHSRPVIHCYKRNRGFLCLDRSDRLVNNGGTGNQQHHGDFGNSIGKHRSDSLKPLWKRDFTNIGRFDHCGSCATIGHHRASVALPEYSRIAL